MEEYPLSQDFMPIFKMGDDKDNPTSLLKILEKTLVVDKTVLSKSMFTAIFSPVTSPETFVRSLLQYLFCLYGSNGGGG